MSEIVIVNTGVANTASVSAAARRLGCKPVLTGEARAVESAGLLVLPGVGSFEAGMASLREHGLVEVIRARIERGRPTLAVCLGMQLLGSASQESPGVEGLGVWDVQAARFAGGVRVPQFGWNRVRAGEGEGAVLDGYAYYANSYRISDAAALEGWRCSMTDHGGAFVAAAERGSVLACQFHPELSGPWGMGLMRRWLVRAREEASC